MPRMKISRHTLQLQPLFKSHKPGAQTFIDYIHHSIDSVRLNGAQLDLNKVVDGSRIMLPELAEENELTVHGRSYYSRSGEGLHRYIDPSDGRVYLYTQYEPADCRRVFPNFEQPDLKAVLISESQPHETGLSARTGF